MLVLGPQNLKSGNCPSLFCKSSRSRGGSVSISGIFPPSVRYVGRGVIRSSTVEFMLDDQKRLAQVTSEYSCRASSYISGASTSVWDCRQDLISCTSLN